MGWIPSATVALFVAAQGLMLLYSAHRYATLWRCRGTNGRRRGLSSASARPGQWPAVTVQLPLYNERAVVCRLIDAVAALEYPASCLQIQVLDDSTDETTHAAVQAAAQHRARGVNIEVIHREDRAGFKAGALAEGLRHALGDLIAVFDADFIPQPEFLKRVVPHFSDPRVGMVQARWGHLNRHRSLLTSAQAVMLDAHFLLEHEARMRSALFFNFNGTAGVWRRAAIESSGGWTHDTLTEDLDLSYRAQSCGWRFVSVPSAAVPAELPADVEALKLQQRRWAKGSIQTARKLLPGLLRSKARLGVKVEAFFHLTSNLTYPLLLLSGLLLLPVMSAVSSTAPHLSLALDVSVILTGIVPVCAFLAVGQAAAGTRAFAIPRAVVAVLVVGAGLSLNNTLAVLQGCGRRLGDWERTPKTGDRGAAAARRIYAVRRSWGGWTELALAVYFSWLSTVAWCGGHGRSTPFLLVLSVGLGYVGIRSILERPWRWSP